MFGSVQIPTSRNFLTAMGGIAVLALGAGLLTGSPSSHREAPFITEMPKVDGTDLYAFRSYEPGRDDFVTLIANYLPFQAPFGGPNYFTLDGDAVYEIHVDSNGDAVEDVTFRFRYRARLRDIELGVGDSNDQRRVSVPLKNVGPITANDTSALNVLEQYEVDVIFGPTAAPSLVVAVSNAVTGETIFDKPVDNIGSKSIPNYPMYASAFLYDADFGGGVQGRVFLGQRKDPFFISLGETFDLLNLNPLGAVDALPNSFENLNVTSFCLEVPRSLLGGGDADGIIGIWTTASLPKNRTLVSDPGYYSPSQGSMELQQVSRLGMPLVNEVVIGLKDKNLFNASEPANDAVFLEYVTHPTLPELIQALFPVVAPNLFPRTDLVQVFLTGVPMLNQNNSMSEMLRLNMGIAPQPSRLQSSLGVLGGDNAGFPNGRRPGDDVVDVTLRVAMGALLDSAVAPDGGLPYTDQTRKTAAEYPAVFPYLNTPLPGAP